MITERHGRVYVFLIILFLVYKALEINQVPLPSFFSNYFEDLLAMPIFLKTGLIGVQLSYSKWRHYKISTRDIVIITTLISVFFEWVIPYFDDRFTSDYIDLLAYFAGSGMFYMLLNQPMKN